MRDYLSNERAGQWLLVFDSADDVDMWIGEPEQDSRPLIEYLPKSKRGTIIFTTRNKKTAVKLAHRNVLEVPGMDASEATQLLQKSLIDQSVINNHKDTATLLVRLTHLPLAIVRAAAYMNENEVTLGDYLSLLAGSFLADSSSGVISAHDILFLVQV